MNKLPPYKPPDKDNFEISSGLKNFIGRELITNDFVAIYELVKNSLDAYATEVDIQFNDDEIIIADNGKGMIVTSQTDEIKNKWLFVAYSAKKEGTEDKNLSNNYRKAIKRHSNFAGNKGVGRFSCDRLGKTLYMLTKQEAGTIFQTVSIDWDNFEKDSANKFEDIKIDRSLISQAEAQKLLNIKSTHNTVLKINHLRTEWNYQKLQQLKRELSKLINPFKNISDVKINIAALAYLSEDDKQTNDQLKVNGNITNNIFKLIGLKTTKIEVHLINSVINTKLTDRGVTIYEIEEACPFHLLHDTNIEIELAYLNQVARTNFTRYMGIHHWEFGHVFLFKNGFRVMPYGEPGQDALGYDRRKSQGYSRYLGSRELIGQINIIKGNSEIIEPSSRDGCLIKNPTYSELEEFFFDNVLKRLEAYVVGVTFRDKSEGLREDASGLLKEHTKVEITALVAKLANNSNIKIIQYNPDIVSIIDERSHAFENSIKNLIAVANANNNKLLLKQIKIAETKYAEVKHAAELAKQAEEAAKKQAEEETKKRREALEKQQLAEAETEKTKLQLEEEKKRSLFLSSLTSADIENVINLHHQIVYDATNIKNRVMSVIEEIEHDGAIFNGAGAIEILQSIALGIQKILKASEFATKANFRHESDGIEKDLVRYVKEYLEVFSSPNNSEIHINCNIEDGTQEFIKTFKPLELSIVIDNLVSNAKKAHAPNIFFNIKNKDDAFQIHVSDDGPGLDRDIEKDRIFELGYSRTSGSGIGLYHVQSVLRQLNGTIKLIDNKNNKAEFLLEILK